MGQIELFNHILRIIIIIGDLKPCYIWICRGIMLTVVGNGHNNTTGLFVFYIALILLGKV